MPDEHILIFDEYNFTTDEFFYPTIGVCTKNLLMLGMARCPKLGWLAVFLAS